MRGLKALMQPNSVVVLGASEKSDSLGSQIIANLHRAEFSGPVLPVHPSYRSVHRLLAYPTVEDLPIAPELAIICTPAEAVADQVARLGSRGTRAAIVVTADPDGRRQGTPFKRDLTAAARAQNMRILGPGSSGIQVPSLGLNASVLTSAANPGKLSLVSQSGSIAASAVDWAARHGVGFANVISTGDEADIRLSEILDYLASDMKTRAVLLYVQTVTDGRAFLSGARALARIKPLLAVKPSGLDGDRIGDEVWDAALQRSGSLRVRDAAEWFDAVTTLGFAKGHTAEKVSVLGNGDGPGLLAASILANEGRLAVLSPETIAKLEATVPRHLINTNPVDIGRDATADRYSAALKALLADPQAGAVLVAYSPSMTADPNAVATAISEIALKSTRQIITCWLGHPPGEPAQKALATANVPVFDTPDKAARAFLNMAHFRRNQKALMELPVAKPSRREEAERQLLLHDEAEGKAVLTAYGIIARHIMEDLSDVSVEDSLSILAAYRFATAPGSKGVRIPLQVSVVSHPVFGRAIVVDGGGRRSVLLPPLNSALTSQTIKEVVAPIETILDQPINGECIERLLIDLGDLLVELPEIVGLEINDLVALGSGVSIRSAKLRVAHHDQKAPHIAIRPYPHQHEERFELKDGRFALVRPIRPDDEGLYNLMLANVSPEDLFLRFCTRFGGQANTIPREMLAKLIQLDYDRDMGFIALSTGADGSVEALGVVDSMASLDRTEAEFSILLRSDLKGTGLGKALMLKIIRHVASQGGKTLIGVVLRNNQPMRGLCTKLGFKTTVDPEDDMVKVSLELAPGIQS